MLDATRREQYTLKPFARRVLTQISPICYFDMSIHTTLALKNAKSSLFPMRLNLRRFFFGIHAIHCCSRLQYRVVLV
jgi:hypothetical protein